MSKISRRKFINKGINASAALGGLLISSNLKAETDSENNKNTPDIIDKPGDESQVKKTDVIQEPVKTEEVKKVDIAVHSGPDYFENTIKAIEQLGGIEQFVSKGDKVGLLINSAFKHPGSYTRPDIPLAVADLCFKAGAKEVCCLKGEDKKYWRRSKIYYKHKELIARLKNEESDHVTTKIPNAKILKEADILEDFLKYDKIINIPIIKDHKGPGYTCTLKNLMGVAPFTTNVKFHLGDSYVINFIKELGDFNSDPERLNQSIADLNLVRKIDLNVVDATEFIITNGPFGPGELKKLNTVVAGADRVAIDSYCCKFLGLRPEKLPIILNAVEHKLGDMNIDKLNIIETKTV